MAQSDSKHRTFLERNKPALQTIGLVLILVIPFILYILAQGGFGAAVTALLVLMTLVMVGIVIIS
jgi:hypothetical protein